MDVSQDVIIRETDCGTERGLSLPIAVRDAEGTSSWPRTSRPVSMRARWLRTSVDRRLDDRDGRDDLGEVEIRRLIDAGVEQLGSAAC